MNIFRYRLAFVLVFCFLLSLANSQAFEEIANGFNQPIGITHAADGSDRLFVIERSGIIFILQNGSKIDEPFLDISERLSSRRGEQGLLGLAFHPSYKENGRLFVNYTDLNGDTVISEFSVSNDPNKADSNSEKLILTFEQPFSNHNGGHLAFSPKDGYLYIGTGDGGDGGDPQENAENLTKYLGKMLRIDIDSASPYAVPEDNPYPEASGALTEIWAHGLRNPWRFSFDRVTADLYIGDVGQRLYEEISFQSADSTGKENYGWDVMEGFHCYEPRNDCDQTGLTLPIAEYKHDENGGVSVTGGYVYRGSAIPSLYGQYVYADFGSGRIWTLERQDGVKWVNRLLEKSDFRISSFGEDEAGELYFTDFASGAVYKFVAQ